jgi:hypothetical protein
MPEQPTFDVTPPGWRPGTPIDAAADFPGSPHPPSVIDRVEGQTFDEYRWSQLEAAIRERKAEIESLSTRLESVRDAVGGINGRLTDVDERVRQLEEAGEVESLNVRLDTHSRSLINLTESVRQLEEAVLPQPKPRDELNDRILEFLEAHPYLKFTAISIDENIGGTGKDISDRLKTLARNGKIRIFAEKGRRPFYQALERNDTPF